MKIICDLNIIPNPLSIKNQRRYVKHIYGLGVTAQQLGNQVVFYQGQVPLLDVIKKQRPDLYIGRSMTVPTNLFDEKIKTIILLDTDQQELTANPDIVVTLNKEREFGGTHINQLPAVIGQQFINGKEKPQFKFQYCYVGNRTLSKEPYIASHILPLLSQDLKIFGSEPWFPFSSHYLGFIREEEKKDLFVSTEYNIHLPSEHLSTLAFEILCAGGRCLSPKTDELYSIFEDRLDYGENFTWNKETKVSNIRFILSNHTYLQRWNELNESIM